MSCDWLHDDCKNEDSKCWQCITEDKFYVPKKKRKSGLAKRQARPSGRRGSNFEYNNHVSNKDLLSGVTTRMTPNSGAGFIKGDEEISGLISIMEELKTSSQTTSRGKKTISIQKEWLDKLKKEATNSSKEFWYLKFAYGDHEKDSYIVCDSEMIMGMVYTMSEDRKAKISAEMKLDIAKLKIDKLEKELEVLKEKLEFNKQQGR